ncbi:MAG: BT_3928 family protein [Bacteroidota bacterium]
MKNLRLISRILVGLIFMFSGFVKAVDPLGSAYKFHDYFVAFHMDWFSPFALYLGILLCTLEFMIGVALFTGVKMRLASVLVTIFMVFFTGLTFILALTNPVSDCGCFGDALILTNWQTFFKNIIIMIFVVIIIVGRSKFKSKLPKASEFSILLFGVVVILFVNIYSYRHLPLIDFLPWKKGNVIAEKVLPTPEKSEVFLIYKNKETGKEMEYTAKTLPYQDTVLMAKLEFKEQKKKVTQEYKEAPIHDFIITSDSGADMTLQFVQNPSFQFFLVAYDLDKADQDVFEKVNPFFAECQKKNISFIALTGSSFDRVKVFKAQTHTSIPFYTVDQTALKSVVRSNPGLVLLHKGVVIDKWHYNDFPSFEKVEKKYLAP